MPATTVMDRIRSTLGPLVDIATGHWIGIGNGGNKKPTNLPTPTTRCLLLAAANLRTPRRFSIPSISSLGGQPAAPRIKTREGGVRNVSEEPSALTSCGPLLSLLVGSSPAVTPQSFSLSRRPFFDDLFCGAPRPARPLDQALHSPESVRLRK